MERERGWRNSVRERQLCSGDVGFVTWRSSSYGKIYYFEISQHVIKVFNSLRTDHGKILLFCAMCLKSFELPEDRTHGLDDEKE